MNFFDKKGIVPIPVWIYRHFLRQGLNTMDFLDYAKVRNLLSAEDMATWSTIVDLPFGLEINCQSLHSLFSKGNDGSANQDSLSDLYSDQTYRALTGFDVVENIKARLSKPLTDKEPPYHFVPYKDTLFLVLGESFLTYVGSEKESTYSKAINTTGMTTAQSLNRKAFISECLQNLYAMAEIHEISRLPLFKTYLKQL